MPGRSGDRTLVDRDEGGIGTGLRVGVQPIDLVHKHGDLTVRRSVGGETERVVAYSECGVGRGGGTAAMGVAGAEVCFAGAC